MFCKDCGLELKEDSIFCKNCGAQVQEIDADIPKKIDHKHNVSETSLSEYDNMAQREEDADAEFIHDHNGHFRWIYEFSLWKNPTILITSLKIMMIACCVPLLLMFFLTLFEEGLVEALKATLSIFGIVVGILTALLAMAYVFIALLYGGKYCALFKMDNKGVHHIQLKKQYSKAQALGFLTLLVGLAGGNFSAAGAGLMSASKQSQYSTFSNVKSVKINEKRSVIYLNETFVHNQIYVNPKNFSYIKDFIIAQCPKNIKIKY